MTEIEEYGGVATASGASNVPAGSASAVSAIDAPTEQLPVVPYGGEAVGGSGRLVGL